MMEKSERAKLEREFLTQVGQRAMNLGFTPKPSGQSFYQNIPNGKWVFHVSFIPHKEDFDLTADLAVRIDKIENLVNEYDTKRSPAEQRKSTTLGGELGNLSAGQPQRWTISNAGDVAAVSDEVVERFKVIGMPFLQVHSEVAAAYRVLTSSDPKDFHLAPILGPRYMRAVASVYLLGNGDRLKTLVREYEAKLVETDDLYLEDFRALCHGLQKRG